MPATVIPLEQAGAWVQTLGRQMPKAAQRGLLAAANRIVATVRLLQLPTDRGVARAGWRAESIPDGAVVYNNVLQATMMEGGVRPDHVKIGRAMIDALAEWVKRKGIGTTNGTGKKRATVDFGTGKATTLQVVHRRVKPSDAVIRSIAWAIAKKMQRRGIFKPEEGGLRPLEKTTKQLGPAYVREEVAREIRKEFGLG